MHIHKVNRVTQPRGHGFLEYYGSGNQELTPEWNSFTQDTWSWGHRVSQLGKGGDEGGPFRTQKVYIKEDETEYQAVGLGRSYHGTLHVYPSGISYGSASYAAPSSYLELVAAGTTAIARAIPTNPMSSAAVAIGELRRDGIPNIIGHSLLKERARDYRKVGDEYLNVEFGWKPMIADLRSFASSVKKQNKILHQLHRDNGKTVRRRLNLPTESRSTYDPLAPYGSWLAPSFCGGGQIDAWMSADIPGSTNGLRSHETYVKKRWFSGAFAYHLPDPQNGFFEKIGYYEACANKLLGTRLTPEVVWNLAPWSWAADWFSNTGDIIHNISQLGTDGLVLRYGYIMESIDHIGHLDLQWGINTPAGPKLIHVLSQHGLNTKTRYQATPFGFGVDLSALTDKQIAITAALGLSRAPRVSM